MFRPGGARVTDRSIHSQSMHNTVAVTGDGNSVTAVFGDTGVRLLLERRQVATPDRRRKPRPGEPPRELDIFAPGAGALPLLGREADLAALRAWLDDPADLSVHALIGEAGSGKTRLALELCRLVDPPDNTGAWRAAFLRPSDLLPIAETLATRAFTGIVRRCWCWITRRRPTVPWRAGWMRRRPTGSRTACASCCSTARRRSSSAGGRN